MPETFDAKEAHPYASHVVTWLVHECLKRITEQLLLKHLTDTGLRAIRSSFTTMQVALKVYGVQNAELDAALENLVNR